MKATLTLLTALLLAPADSRQAAEEGAIFKFAGGNQAELQAVLDKAPAGAVVVCEQTQPLDISMSLLLDKPMTLRGLKARLQPKVGKTPILIADATGITLTDIELHGNYDSVNQQHRAPLIQLKRGGFQIERCKFSDGTKDGIMVTPEDGKGDIVGGTIRDIEGARMGRDLVSLGGGNGGQRIRDVTVENVRLIKGYHRGAVEVSDGADNITVRRVYAEDAPYAIDVQDHGPVKAKTGRACAPNTKVFLEDVTAVRCQNLIRTANCETLKHADLTLRNFTARDCAEPLRIRNTTRVLIENLTVSNDKPLDRSPIELNNDHNVIIRNATIKMSTEGVPPVTIFACTDVQFERVTCNGRAVEQPAIGKGKGSKNSKAHKNTGAGAGPGGPG